MAPNLLLPTGNVRPLCCSPPASASSRSYPSSRSFAGPGPISRRKETASSPSQLQDPCRSISIRSPRLGGDLPRFNPGRDSSIRVESPYPRKKRSAM